MTLNPLPQRRLLLETVASGIESGPYGADWDSLKHKQVPAWYEDGKFGIFIHWGVYSVPAFENEWYPRNMYIQGSAPFEHHREVYGEQNVFGYKDFIPEFTAENFDADTWATLFRRAGAQFVVPVAEHHDGFPMYDCTLTRWKATEMGPRRDVIGELADAVRRQSMTFGVSSHRAEHWFFFNGGTKFDSDVLDSEFADFYGPAQREEIQPNKPFLQDWLARTSEIVDRYHPELVWFDWYIEQPAFEPYLREFAAYYYNRGEEWEREVAINYKFEAFVDGSAVFDIERGQLSGIRDEFWQTDTSVSKNSWSYVTDHQYKAALGLIADLVDIVSKNGALLLNIGPRADGTIPEAEVRLLEEIGAWLDVNGEAIYGTRPWSIAGEGPTSVLSGPFTDTERTEYTPSDIRFTTARGDLYATVLAPTRGSEVLIRSLAAGSGVYTEEIQSVTLLGYPGDVVWSRREDGLCIELPTGAATETLASFRIIAGPPIPPARRKILIQ
jgi:alpha-L-fucosidase